MYIIGYAILVAAMFLMVTFSITTPVWLSILVTGFAGFGLGVIPTLNTLYVQFSVPRRLLGVAVGAMFFFVMMGMAITPSILGSAMNASYARFLKSNLPAELSTKMDPAALASLSDPRVLLSSPALEALETTFNQIGEPALFVKTVAAIRGGLEASLKTVFLIGAITMFISFVLIATIPEVCMDVDAEDRGAAAAGG
jgi:MFS family permease